MRFDEEFAQRLQSVRSEKGLSQQDLSRLSGVPQAQLSRYESGLNKPRPHIISKLAQALGVSVQWLASGEIPFFEGEKSVSIFIRLPVELLGALKEEADRRGSDLSDEIAMRLDNSLMGGNKINCGDVSLPTDVAAAVKYFSYLNGRSASDEITSILRNSYFGVIAGETMSEQELLAFIKEKIG